MPYCSEAWDAIARYIYTGLQGGSIMKGYMQSGRKVSMKKRFCCIQLIGCGMICAVLLTGCYDKHSTEKEQEETTLEQETSGNGEIKDVEARDVETESGDFPTKTMAEPGPPEPEVIETDWSEYFDGFNGAAVVYDASALRFDVYNSALAKTRRSPCSTFKIISSLVALENGIIDPDDSTRKWSGEIFWNEKWNNDIDFSGAFHESCVWYFREVIDEIGQELMQEELDRLLYGNCDISDWEGRLNTNNNNRALTGFWIESSLAISPKEQTEVMERIFGEDSVYSETVRNELKEVMLVETQKEEDICVYGKTGMGKAEGVTVDAWFVGFAENAGENIYFCVYLGRTDDKNVTSAAAKEIALRLVLDYGEISGNGLK